MNTFNIRLNLDKSVCARTEVVTIRQGDVDGTSIAAQGSGRGVARQNGGRYARH